MSLNLKALEAEANRDGTMMSDDFLALLRALRETRTALLAFTKDGTGTLDEMCHARTVLEGVQDD